MKEYIKSLVKESLAGILKEKSKTPEKGETKNKTQKDEKNLDDRDQVSIQNAADSELAPPKSHIMKAAGLGNPNDASDRAKFVKKLDQEYGQGFTDNEKAKVSKVLNSIKT